MLLEVGEQQAPAPVWSQAQVKVPEQVLMEVPEQMLVQVKVSEREQALVRAASLLQKRGLLVPLRWALARQPKARTRAPSDQVRSRHHALSLQTDRYLAHLVQMSRKVAQQAPKSCPKPDGYSWAYHLRRALQDQCYL